MAVFQPNQPDREADQAAHNTATILVFPYERMPHWVDRTARRVASYATRDDRNQAMVAVITEIYNKLSDRAVDDRLKEKTCINCSNAVWAMVAKIDRRGRGQ